MFAHGSHISTRHRSLDWTDKEAYFPNNKFICDLITNGGPFKDAEYNIFHIPGAIPGPFWTGGDTR